MNRFTWMWVATLAWALMAPGCGLVLDTQARDGSGSDAGTGRTDLGAIECVDATDCDDDDFCNGPEDCLEGRCVAVDIASPCGDGVGCTDDLCDAVLGCANIPNDSRCGPDQYCDPLDDCQPIPTCERPADCPPDPCAGTNVACTNNRCVYTQPLNCMPPSGSCLVGFCAAGQCVYTPDDRHCDTDANGECGVSRCLPSGQCETAVPDGSRCDDGIDCTVDSCQFQEGSYVCERVPVHSLCDDGVDCTQDLCMPNDPSADILGNGCIFRLDDSVCVDQAGGEYECAMPICLRSGCEDGVRVVPCIEGGACDVEGDTCEYSDGCPDNCADYGSPCAPARCDTDLNECVTDLTDPCFVNVPGVVGYCDLSGSEPRCATRVDLLGLINPFPGQP